jgi:hypothetical protein
MTGAIGTTRNLTTQFLRYRNDAKRARGTDAYAEDRYAHLCMNLLQLLLSQDSCPLLMHDIFFSARHGLSDANSWLFTS